MTGSTELWALAERLDVVPTPPDPVLADLLTDWWTGPRHFGCTTAHGGLWVVVAPDPTIWCHDCALRQYAHERRCLYCGQPVRVKRSNTLVYEMNGGVKVLVRAHRHCTEHAARQPHPNPPRDPRG